MSRRLSLHILLPIEGYEEDKIYKRQDISLRMTDLRQEPDDIYYIRLKSKSVYASLDDIVRFASKKYSLGEIHNFSMHTDYLKNSIIQYKRKDYVITATEVKQLEKEHITEAVYCNEYRCCSLSWFYSSIGYELVPDDIEIADDELIKKAAALVGYECDEDFADGMSDVIENNTEAYVRVGNESVKATATELKRLVLRGKNTSYDSQNSTYKEKDYAFSKLKERYKKWTGNSFDDKDLISFGLVNERGNLTNAGALLVDESSIRCSRLFCTRGNGLNKSGGAVDALDDAEYSGSVISLIENGEAFIKRNCKMKWRKTANSREEMPEYINKETLRKNRQIFEIGNDGYVWNVWGDKSFVEKLGG